MVSGPLIRYVLTAARRDRLMITLALMVLAGASLSVFLGGAAIVEQGQFALVFAAGGLRILGAAGVVLFVCFHMRRAFEHKEVEFLLSRPVSRTAFLLSHAAAFIVLAFLAALLVSLPMLLAGVPSLSGLLAWSGSVAVEYAIMAVAALFFSMVLSSAAACALAAFGLYALARLTGTLLGISAAADNIFLSVLGRAMDVISIVVPRLDLMGQTSWLVYGVEGAAGVGLLKGAGPWARFIAESAGVGGFVAAQGVVFTALLVAAAGFDFARRRF